MKARIIYKQLQKVYRFISLQVLYREPHLQKKAHFIRLSTFHTFITISLK